MWQSKKLECKLNPVFSEVQGLWLTFFLRESEVLFWCFWSLLWPGVEQLWARIWNSFSKKVPSLFDKQKYLKRFTNFSEVFVLNLKLWCILSYWCCGKCFGGQTNLQEVLSCVRFVFKSFLKMLCSLTTSSSLTVLWKWLVKKRLRWVVVVSFVLASFWKFVYQLGHYLLLKRKNSRNRAFCYFYFHLHKLLTYYFSMSIELSQLLVLGVLGVETYCYCLWCAGDALE